LQIQILGQRAQRWRIEGTGLKWCSSRHEIRIFCATTSPAAHRLAIATCNAAFPRHPQSPSIESKKGGQEKIFWQMNPNNRLQSLWGKGLGFWASRTGKRMVGQPWYLIYFKCGCLDPWSSRIFLYFFYILYSARRFSYFLRKWNRHIRLESKRREI